MNMLFLTSVLFASIFFTFFLELLIDNLGNVNISNPIMVDNTDDNEQILGGNKSESKEIM